MRVSLNHEQRALAGQIGQQLGGISGFAVVFMLLGGELADAEDRLDDRGREMLSQLRAILGVEVHEGRRPPPGISNAEFKAELTGVLRATADHYRRTEGHGGHCGVWEDGPCTCGKELPDVGR